MTHKVLLLGLLMTGIFEAGAFAQRLAFEREGTIYLAGSDGKDAEKLTKGVYPNLSPDGAKVAYNTEGPDRVTERRIVVRNINSGSEIIITRLPSDNCFAPVWSPDGSKMAFHTLYKDEWRIGVINADGNGFHFMDPRGVKADIWGAAWSPDGKSLYCHDMANIYQTDAGGHVLRRWNVAKIIPGGSLNSSSGLSVSPDGKTLLVGVDMDERIDRRDLDMPPSAVWALNLADGRATRLSPKGVLEWDPVWIGNTAFLCRGELKKYPGPVVYRVSADGAKRSLLLKNAASPSMAPL